MTDRSVSDSLHLLFKSLPPERPLEWRRDPARRKALRKFPGRRVRELAALVERRPGFRDAEARHRFGSYIRAWAREWTAGGWWVPRPAYRQGAKARLVSVAQAADALARALDELDPRELRAVSRHLAWLVRDRDRVEEPAYRASLTPEVQDGLRALSTFDRNEKRAAQATATLRGLPPALAVAAGRAAEIATVPTRFPDQQGLAFRDLAILWQQVTGREPTESYRSVDGSRGGAFPEFARLAMQALWPNAGDLDGLIRIVCAKPIRKKD